MNIKERAVRTIPEFAVAGKSDKDDLMNLPPKKTKDVVLVGGGHAHALFLRRWGMKPLNEARLTLISPSATTAYTGMLPGVVAGHYRPEDLEIDLVKLARFRGFIPHLRKNKA